MNILCLDPGLSHTGIAISTEGLLASPLSTIHQKDPQKMEAEIVSLIKKYQPTKIVIGIPESGEISLLAPKLQKTLQSYFPKTEFILYSEDLSSKMAESILSQHKAKKDDHQIAAAVILQQYLDSI